MLKTYLIQGLWSLLPFPPMSNRGTTEAMFFSINLIEWPNAHHRWSYSTHWQSFNPVRALTATDNTALPCQWHENRKGKGKRKVREWGEVQSSPIRTEHHTENLTQIALFPFAFASCLPPCVPLDPITQSLFIQLHRSRPYGKWFSYLTKYLNQSEEVQPNPSAMIIK